MSKTKFNKESKESRTGHRIMAATGFNFTAPTGFGKFPGLIDGPLTALRLKINLNLRGVHGVVSLQEMSAGNFSIQAAVLWGAIPLAAKQQILANVFCVTCQGIVQMVNFKGKLDKRGDVILKGSCAVCGHRVVRVLETSENRNANN